MPPQPERPTLYLTFDDGPIPEITDFVVETLGQFQANATFFCVGDNIQKHPEVFQRIQHLGHSVGNHTYNHLNGWRTPNSNYWENIKQCKQAMQEHSLANVPWQIVEKPLFRPPYGRFTGKQANIIHQHFTVVMWDVLTNDYDKRLSPEKCLRASLRSSTDGAIVVLHDSLKAAKNMMFTLPRYLAHFKEKGYQFAAL